VDVAQLTRQRTSNLIRSVGLLAAIFAFVGFLGQLVLGASGVVWFAAGFAALAIANSGAGARMLLQARKAQPIADPGLQHLVRELAARADVPAPQLVGLPSNQMEAFTVGSKGRGTIAISAGMLRRLTPRELAAVLAHEVSHLRHHDLFFLGMARSLGRFGRFLSGFGLLAAVLALPAVLFGAAGVPFAAVLLLLVSPRVLMGLENALSRSREFDADAGAAALTGDPEALGSALAKVEQAQLQQDPMWRLFGRAARAPTWLQSHPPTHERRLRLGALGGERRWV